MSTVPVPRLMMPKCDYCQSDAEIGILVEVYPLDNVPREFTTPIGTAIIPAKGDSRMCGPCVVRAGFIAQSLIEKGKERTS